MNNISCLVKNLNFKEKIENTKEMREVATEQVMEKEWSEELASTVTNCLMKRDNETLQQLLQKMTRMVRNRADQLSRGLSEAEVSAIND